MTDDVEECELLITTESRQGEGIGARKSEIKAL